jgi:hypothetical protein
MSWALQGRSSFRHFLRPRFSSPLPFVRYFRRVVAARQASFELIAWLEALPASTEDREERMLHSSKVHPAVLYPSRLSTDTTTGETYD